MIGSSAIPAKRLIPSWCPRESDTASIIIIHDDNSSHIQPSSTSPTQETQLPGQRGHPQNTNILNNVQKNNVRSSEMGSHQTMTTTPVSSVSAPTVIPLKSITRRTAAAQHILTTKQQKKQLKNSSTRSNTHQVLLIDSDIEDSFQSSQIIPDSEEEPTRNRKQPRIEVMTKKRHYSSIERSTNQIEIDKIEDQVIASQNIFSLEATLSGTSTANTTGSSAEQEDFSDIYEFTSEDSGSCDYPKGTKKFKIDNQIKDNATRKFSILSNSLETINVSDSPIWQPADKVNNANIDKQQQQTSANYETTLSQSTTPSPHTFKGGKMEECRNKINRCSRLASFSDEDSSYQLNSSSFTESSDVLFAGRVVDAMEEVKQLVEQRMGRLAAEISPQEFPCCTLSIRCFLKHVFSLTAFDLLSSHNDNKSNNHQQTSINTSWCSKCVQQLRLAHEYAAQNGGECLNEVLTKTLRFRCSSNHEWESSHTAYKQQRWCLVCKNIAKQQYRKYIEEQESQKQQEYQKNQEQMYKQAREKALREQSITKTQSQGDVEFSKRVIVAGKQVEIDVEKIAETQAIAFLAASSQPASCKLADVKEVLKIILFPEQILSLYLANLPLIELNAFYRNAARNVHPDKNRHPRASEAFQKLNNIYSAALPKSRQ